MTHLLSKSKYIRGLQCERALWLDVNCPKLAKYTREQMVLFDYGRYFEGTFKQTFPNAIDISLELKHDRDAYPDLTAKLLDEAGEKQLFEAGFVFDSVLVLADVVSKRIDGQLDIYEVKSSTAVTPTIFQDAAIQYYVISHCRPVATFNVVHREGDSSFATVDLTERLAAQTDRVAQNIETMKEVLRHGEPDTPTGQHCLTPYACPYQKHCLNGGRQLRIF